MSRVPLKDFAKDEVMKLYGLAGDTLIQHLSKPCLDSAFGKDGIFEIHSLQKYYVVLKLLL